MTKDDPPVKLLIELMKASGGIPIGMKHAQELLDCLHRRGFLESGFAVQDGYLSIWVQENIFELFELLTESDNARN